MPIENEKNNYAEWKRSDEVKGGEEEAKKVENTGEGAKKVVNRLAREFNELFQMRKFLSALSQERFEGKVRELLKKIEEEGAKLYEGDDKFGGSEAADQLMMLRLQLKSEIGEG